MTTGRKRTLALVAVSLALATAATAPAAGPVERPPLGLGGGRVGDYAWRVEASQADRGPAPGRRPCLLVGTKWQVGPLDFRRSRSRQCSGTTRLTAIGPPLTASGSQPGPGGKGGLTAVGMIFAPAARRVEVTLAGGEQMTIALRRPPRTRATEAGLEPFRYAAFAVHGFWCAERMVSRNAGGRVLWDSGTDAYTCPAQP